MNCLLKLPARESALLFKDRTGSIARKGFKRKENEDNDVLDPKRDDYWLKRLEGCVPCCKKKPLDPPFKQCPVKPFKPCAQPPPPRRPFWPFLLGLIVGGLGAYVYHTYDLDCLKRCAYEYLEECFKNTSPCDEETKKEPCQKEEIPPSKETKDEKPPCKEKKVEKQPCKEKMDEKPPCEQKQEEKPCEKRKKEQPSPPPPPPPPPPPCPKEPEPPPYNPDIVCNPPIPKVCKKPKDEPLPPPPPPPQKKVCEGKKEDLPPSPPEKVCEGKKKSEPPPSEVCEEKKEGSWLRRICRRKKKEPCPKLEPPLCKEKKEEEPCPLRKTSKEEEKQFLSPCPRPKQCKGKTEKLLPPQPPATECKDTKTEEIPSPCKPIGQLNCQGPEEKGSVQAKDDEEYIYIEIDEEEDTNNEVYLEVTNCNQDESSNIEAIELYEETNDCQ